MFSRKTLAEEHSALIARLHGSERIPPRHEPAATILGNNGPTSRATVAHDYFFADFVWFGALLNQHISEPWGVEELPDTNVRDPHSDGPDLGRRYRVHYNAVEMGTVQATLAGMDWIFEPEKFKQSPQALVLIDLNWMRFVPHGDALSFVYAVERLVGKWVDDEDSRSRAELAATRALTGYLWEALRQDDMVPQFSWRTTGPYDLLRLTNEHWTKGAIDPFERWGGDRLGARR